MLRDDDLHDLAELESRPEEARRDDAFECSILRRRLDAAIDGQAAAIVALRDLTAAVLTEIETGSPDVGVLRAAVIRACDGVSYGT